MTPKRLQLLAQEADELSALTPVHPFEIVDFEKWSSRLRGLVTALTSDEKVTASEAVKDALAPGALGELIASLHRLFNKARAYSGSNRDLVASALTTIGRALRAGAGAGHSGGLFISFSHRDEKIADLLFESLDEARLNPFKSSHPVKGLAPGRGYFENILQALRSADALVLLATPSSVTEQWPLFEAGALVGRDLPVLSVCVGITLENLPTPLRQLQAVLASERIKVRHALAQVVGKTLDEVWTASPSARLEAFLEAANPRSPRGSAGKALIDYDPFDRES